jgi:hypothetical protein
MVQLGNIHSAIALAYSFYTAHGHKLRFFTLRKPQFMTVPSIVSCLINNPMVDVLKDAYLQALFVRL